MLIENTILSGFGASIGSVPADVVAPGDTPHCVRNVTFRNNYLDAGDGQRDLHQEQPRLPEATRCGADPGYLV